MSRLINLNINKYKEAGIEYYVATSDDVRGLVVEGETLEKTIKLSKEIARDLIELKRKNEKKELIFQKIPSFIKYPLILEGV